VFVKTETGQKFGPMEGTPEAGTQNAGDMSRDGYKMGVGAIVGLGTNESIEIADPKRPNTGYDAFFESILRQIGMALEIPFELLIKHFTASYSAARAAMLEAWRAFLTRREWFARRFMQPIYEAFVEEAVAKGRINLPGYLQADAIMRQAWLGSEWVGPGRGQIDELKEAQAADFRIKAGLSTKSIEVPNLTGKDWEDVQQQLARERDVATELGNTDTQDGIDPQNPPADPNKEDNPGGPDTETPPKKETA
jgi:lambda family phage portal protein